MKFRISNSGLIAVLIWLFAGINLIGILNIYYLLPIIISGCFFAYALADLIQEKNGRLKINADNEKYILYIMSLQCLVFMIHNILLNVLGRIEAAYVKASFVQLACNWIVILGGWGFSYLLKEKNFKYMKCSLAMIFIATLVYQLFNLGIVEFFKGILSVFTKQEIVNPLETCYDAVFSFGLLLIYMVNGKYFGNKAKLSKIILFSIFIILCGKRSLYLAIGVLIVFSIMSIWIPKQKIHYIENVASIIMVAGYYMLVALLKNGVFSLILNHKGINTMGRIKMWDFITDYFEFSPLYIGRGYNFASLTVLENKVLTYKGNVYAWHGVVFSIFVDMGFIMFGFWLIYNLIVVPKLLRKKYNFYISNLYWELTVYLFMLYLTESVINGVLTQATYMVILMHSIYISEFPKQKEKYALKGTDDD